MKQQSPSDQQGLTNQSHSNPTKSRQAKSNPPSKDIYDKLVDYRIALTVLTLLVTIVTGLGLSGLGYNTSFRIFFEEDDPFLHAYDELGDNFTHYENLIYVVTAKDDNLYSQADINSIIAITEKSLDIPFVFQTSSLSNYTFMSSPEEDELAVNDLIDDSLIYDEKKLEELKALIRNDPLIFGRLINDKGNITIIVADLGIQYDIKDRDAVDQTLAAAQKLKQAVIADNDDVEIYLHGTIMDNYSTREVSNNDMNNLMPLIVLAGCLISFFITRSFAALVASQLTVILTVITAIGILGWMKVELNVVSSMATLLIIVLALADTIHIGTSYLRELKHSKTKKEAMATSLRTNFFAIFITSITTAAGFASLNTIGSAAFADLGNIATLGVLIALIYSVTVFPGTLILLTKQSEYKGINQEAVAAKIADIALRYQKPFAIFFTVIVFVSVPFITQNRFNNDYRFFYDESMEIRQATEALITKMDISRSIEYIIDTNTPNGINNPEILKELDNFIEWLKLQPETGHVFSYIDFLKRLNQTMHNGDETFYRLPNSQDLASQYLLLYEMSADTDNMLTPDKSTMRIIVSTHHMENQQFLNLEKRAQQWLTENGSGIVGNGISRPMLFAQAGEEIVTRMAKGATMTILFVTAVMILGLRSLKYGLLSLLPNLIPPLVIYGLWGLFIKDVDQGLAVTYSLSLGIIIDDTVHIMAKYIKQRKNNISPHEAIHKALEHSAVALINTTLVIGSGLFILTFAEFYPNANIARIMAPTILLALFFDLFMLPALLLFADRKITENKATTRTHENKHP